MKPLLESLSSFYFASEELQCAIVCCRENFKAGILIAFRMLVKQAKSLQVARSVHNTNECFPFSGFKLG